MMNMVKILWGGIFAAVLLTGSVWGQAVDPDILINKILSANPELSAAQNALEATRRKAGYSGAWNDPQASLSLGNKQAVSITQMIPNLGKQGLRVQLAELESQTAALQLESLRREFRRQVLGILNKISAAEQSLQLGAEEQKLLAGMKAVALRQYESGTVSQQDPIRITLAQAELTMRLTTIRQQKDSLLAELRQLAGGREVELPPLTIALLHAGRQNNPAVSLRTNPTVARAEIEYQKAMMLKASTEVIRQPEFDLGTEYDIAMNAFSVMAGISLPLWGDKNSGQIAEADTLLEVASQNVKSALLKIQFQLENAVLQLAGLESNLRVYAEEIFPQSQAAFLSAQAAYINGILPFKDWLEAKTRILETKMAIVRIEAEIGETLAELEKIKGRES